MATESPERIENQFAQLSTEAQLSLLERLVHRVRVGVSGGEKSWEAELSAMAADPQIRRELSSIEEEFRSSDADGLGSE